MDIKLAKQIHIVLIAHVEGEQVVSSFAVRPDCLAIAWMSTSFELAAIGGDNRIAMGIGDVEQTENGSHCSKIVARVTNTHVKRIDIAHASVVPVLERLRSEVVTSYVEMPCVARSPMSGGYCVLYQIKNIDIIREFRDVRHHELEHALMSDPFLINQEHMLKAEGISDCQLLVRE